MVIGVISFHTYTPLEQENQSKSLYEHAKTADEASKDFQIVLGNQVITPLMQLTFLQDLHILMQIPRSEKYFESEPPEIKNISSLLLTLFRQIISPNAP